MLSIIFIAWGAVVAANPYTIGLLFFSSLLLFICVLYTYRKFIRFVLFLVYIGGLLVLISYCLILIPSKMYSLFAISPLFLSLFLSSRTTISPYCFGVYQYCLVFFLGLLLYYVLLRVVGIVSSCEGALKRYV